MSKKISLGDVIKSKISDKSDLPQWYQERLKICGECPLNSANKPKQECTTKERLWVAANLGKPTCLACKCEIEAKASLPHAVCGKNEIGLEPEWYPIESISKTSNVEITVDHTGYNKLTVEQNKGEVTFNFGTIVAGEPKKVKLYIKDIHNNITDISVKSSCGCTIPKVEKIGQNIKVEMVYNNKNTGDFNKTVVLMYTQNNTDYEKIFKLKGKAN